MDDERLGRLFAPPYEEPKTEEEKEQAMPKKAPPPTQIFTYLDK